MPPPLITVALCVYNGSRFLREQLDSVLAQTGVAIEIVAVDDASSDDSVELLNTYAARDARIRVFVNARNLGPRASFERAMSLGRGDFFAPCDQDDIWLATKLARLLAAIGDADLAYCDSRFVDADGHPDGRRVSDEIRMMAGRDPLAFAFANSVSGHAALLRRDVFERARPFPAGVFHDWWLAMLAAAGNGVVHVDEPLVLFRRHGDAFSSLGRAHGMRSAARHRAWIDDRLRLLDALTTRVRPGVAGIACLHDALAAALRDGRRGPLLGELWRARRSAPGARGAAVIAGVRLQLRFLRKLRAARRHPHAVPPERRL